jgi:hypothetical protein
MGDESPDAVGIAMGLLTQLGVTVPAPLVLKVVAVVDCG